MKKIVFILLLPILLTSCIGNSGSDANHKDLSVTKITNEQAKELLKKNTLNENEIQQLKDKSSKDKSNEIFISADNWKIDTKIDDKKLTNKEASKLGIQ